MDWKSLWGSLSGVVTSEMLLKLVLMCLVVLGVQLAICLKASKVMTKLWPVIILTGLEIVCGVIVLTVGVGTETKAVISSFASAQMLLTGFLLIPVDLAWLVYGIIWLIQQLIDRIKNPENKTEV